MVLSTDSKTEISWWINNIKIKNGKLIRQKAIDCWIETDASLEGWGCKFGKNFNGGRWNEKEKAHHINYLEILAIFYSLKAYF